MKRHNVINENSNFQQSLNFSFVWQLSNVNKKTYLRILLTNICIHALYRYYSPMWGRLPWMGCGHSHLQGRCRNKQSYSCRCMLKLVQNRSGAGKKFFVQLTECWPSACENDHEIQEKKFNAAVSLWYKGVATFSNGGKTTDWSFHLSVILQEICSASWQPLLLVNKCLVWLDMLWIAEEQI